MLASSFGAVPAQEVQNGHIGAQKNARSSTIEHTEYPLGPSFFQKFRMSFFLTSMALCAALVALSSIHSIK